MSEDVRQYIRTCEWCTRFKQPVERAEIKPILCTHPMELVHIDFLTVGHPEQQTDKSNDCHRPFYPIHTSICDTKPNCSSGSKNTMGQFLTHYGWPTKILTDQGKSFKNNIFRELCALAQVQKLRTTPYRPQSNGSCERFNQMLIRMLGTLPQHAKKNWSEWVCSLTNAYNATVLQAMGFCPFYLMYRRYPILPIDIEFGVTLPNLTAAKRQNYAEKLKAHLKWTFKTAKETSDREAAQHKRYYDQKYKCMKMELRNLVLVRIKAFGPDHKIADRWEQTPYIVLLQLHNGLVFKVQPVDREEEDSIRVLHQNMLFSFQTIRTESDSEGEIRASSAVLLAKANQLMEEYFN